MKHKIQVQECSSIDDSQLDQMEQQIFDKQSIQISKIKTQLPQKNKEICISLNQVINLMPKHSHRQVKFVGRDSQAVLRAYYYMLFTLSRKQREEYPHLTSIIKEQFNRPNVFKNIINQKLNYNNYLNLTQKYFDQVQHNPSFDLQGFLCRNPLFNIICITMLKTILQGLQLCKEQKETFAFLSKKFAIAFNEFSNASNTLKCYSFGLKQNVIIIKKNGYFFLLCLEKQETFDQKKLHVIQSVPLNFLQSVAQLSEQNTPKFKNSDENHYSRQISHFTEQNNKKETSSCWKKNLFFDHKEEKNSNKIQRSATFNMPNQQNEDKINDNIKRQKIKRKFLTISQQIKPQKIPEKYIFIHHHQKQQQYKTKDEKKQIRIKQIEISKSLDSEFQQFLNSNFISSNTMKINKLNTSQSIIDQKVNIERKIKEQNEMTSDAIIDILQSSVQVRIKQRKYSQNTKQNNPISSHSFGNTSKNKPYQFLNHQPEKKLNGQNQLKIQGEIYNLKEQILKKQSDNFIKTSNKYTQTYNSAIRSNEPMNWIKKQTTYYFREKSPQIIIQNRAKSQISFCKPRYENFTMKNNHIIQRQSNQQSSYLQLNQQNRNYMPIIRIPPPKSIRVIKPQFIDNHNVTMYSPPNSYNNSIFKSYSQQNILSINQNQKNLHYF